ncbi:uncharacterized protein LOC131951187 [Physella acuta]|uniref:uncharacterized protein LOC131951187 n=1 Tax=Physella acuta TaxID=109671 RepID=UPI0027DB56F8|nr:uncharacterized protein LOC131951187 [Physella acuta]
MRGAGCSCIMCEPQVSPVCPSLPKQMDLITRDDDLNDALIGKSMSTNVFHDIELHFDKTQCTSSQDFNQVRRESNAIFLDDSLSTNIVSENLLVKVDKFSTENRTSEKFKNCDFENVSDFSNKFSERKKYEKISPNNVYGVGTNLTEKRIYLHSYLTTFLEFLCLKDTMITFSFPTHRKRVNRIEQVVLFVFLGLIQLSSCLRTGQYPAYDSMCMSRLQQVPVMWDCKGYIQCMPLGEGTFRAVWLECSEGRYYDPDKAACVVHYDKCRPPRDVALNICPSKPYLKFPHPASCALYYDCSQPRSRPGLAAWENECPDPLLFDEATYTCRKRNDGDTQFCGSRPEPNGKCEYRLGCTDKNCTGLDDGPHYDPAAPFTEKYYLCKNGSVSERKTCEEDGHIFDAHKRECTDTPTEDSVHNFCLKNPTAIFPDPSRCSLFYDCSQYSWHPSLKPYQTECAYPRLFDPETSSCASFLDVRCGRRKETIQPCDYIVGHCVDAGCVPCVASCLGLRDGSNAYPGRVLTVSYLVCQRERTIDIRTCAGGSVFDPQMRTCLSEISSATLDIYCANNPDGRLLHPSECSMFYSCTQHNNTQTNPNLPPRAIECKYPYLVDAGTVMCKPHTLVKCGARREPFSPCDYVSNRCTSQACTKCELVMPSCYGKADNYYPAINQEMTAHYIVCKDQRVMGAGVCPNGTIFDIRTLTCTDTVYPLSLLEFCTNYHTGRVQNPSNCAQYYDCATSLTEVTECTYPDLYDVTSHLCLPYSQVTCAGRPIFLDPCDSFTFCPVQPCPYCNSAYPSCVGRNGAVGGFRFEPSMYYQCVNERLVLKYCQTTFNWTARACNELISPVSFVQYVATTAAPTTLPPRTTTTSIPPTAATIGNICKATPRQVLTKDDNCAQFYNCSKPRSPLGPYVDECPVGSLFNTKTKTCQPYSEVQCLGRLEPKQACDYQPNCNRTGSGCPDCLLTFPSCINVTNGVAAHSSVFQYSQVYCRNGRVVNATLCPAGQFYDGIRKQCSSFMSNDFIKSVCRTRSDQLLTHPLSCAKYIKCEATNPRNASSLNFQLKECPYPLLFQNGMCLNYKTVQCGRRKQAIAPCDYDELRKCKFSDSSCRVNSADTCPDKHELTCVPCEKRYPSCIGSPNGLVAYPGRLFTPDFVRCDEGRTLAILKCVQSMFDPDARTCGLKLDTVMKQVQRNPVSFCQRYPTALIPHETHCARFFNCSAPATPGIEGVAHLQECRHPKLFDSNQRRCENFIEVLNTVGCGTKIQPKHFCDYASLCPSQRFKTCDDCRRVLPSCNNQVNGIHGNPPGQALASGFMYCVEGRVVATSPCPHGSKFQESVKSCVPQTTPKRNGK